MALFVERARGVRPGFGLFDEQTADAVIRICETLDGLPLGIELAAARMAAMSAVEVRDRLDQRLRLLTGPELGPDRQATLRHTVAWSYDLLDDEERATLRTASTFAGGFDLPALCAVAEASDDVDVLRVLDSLVRKSLVIAHHGSARTRYSLFETIRAFVDEQLGVGDERQAAGDRHASYFASEAVRRWERWNGPEWRDQVDWVQRELANLRSAYRWSLDRGQVETATDVAAHAALMGFSVELFETIGWAEAVLPAAESADVRRLPRLYAAAGYACFVGRAEVATANAHRATELEARPGYESCEPGYATFIEALGQVYCGNLDRYVELTRLVAALPGDGQAYGIAAYVDGLQSAGRVEEALQLTEPALTAARDLGNPYWLIYTLWIVGLTYSKTDPQRAMQTWDEGVAYLDEHDVRFFEGFLSRDAALVHTSDGQLETALSLFGTSIRAFVRSGAVSQLVISLASLPALFERLGRPAVARTVLGAMAREEASFHHVPGLVDLGGRLDEQLGQEASERFEATGRTMDVRDTATYALHQIDLARRALTTASQGAAGAAGLTTRETQVLGLIADGASTREISERLFISAKTADNHIQHIYIKLGVTNRAAATRWAFDHDVVEADRDPKWGISSCGEAASGRGFGTNQPPGWQTPGPKARHEGERHDPGNDEGEGPRPLPRGVQHQGRRQARVPRLTGGHGVPRPDRGGPGVGRLRLGRGGLDGVRHGPGDPRHHAGGRTPGPAVPGPVPRQLLRLKRGTIRGTLVRRTGVPPRYSSPRSVKERSRSPANQTDPTVTRVAASRA